MQLNQALKHVINYGGEGIIMRKPRSAYFKGRSVDLVKLKAMRGDMEGLVVRVKQHYIRLQLPNGSFMNVDNADVRIPHEDREMGSPSLSPVPSLLAPLANEMSTTTIPNINPNSNTNTDINTDTNTNINTSSNTNSILDTNINMIQTGAIVSFSYTINAHTNQPAQPVVYRIRRDLHWRDVLRSYHSENNALSLNEVSQRLSVGPTINNFSHKSVEKTKQMRNQLELFAKSQHMDPLKAKTWYKLSKNASFLRVCADSKKLESCRIPWTTVFKGSVVKAVMSLFPEISFSEEQFAIAPRHHWFSIRNRRDFFEDFAQDQHFDALVPDNWYDHTADSLRSFKGADGMLRHFQGNYAKALIQTFPEIGLDENKLYRKYWLDNKNQQEVFIQFAQHHGFSAFSADSWYSVHPDTFQSSKSVCSVLQFYDGSYSKALVHLFPSIGLSEDHLQAYWEDHMHRKQLFINYAKERGYQPVNSDSWYKMDLSSLILQKGINSVLRYYDGSISNALTNLFPNIEIDKNKIQRRFWLDMKNKQQIFIDFANKHQFDHLNPKKWYEVDLTQVPIPMKPHSLANQRLQCVKLLLHLFPNIGLDKAKFNVGLGKAGMDIKTRKEFFMNFAREKGFDPLISNNWYSISSDDLSSTKEGRSVAKRYGGSFPKALLHVFPNIGLQHSKLSNRSLLFWKEVENKKNFFVKIAQDKGFDPLVASNWYPITLSEILEYKGSRSILPQYNGSFIAALQDIFHFKFDVSKFAIPEYKFWKDIRNRRKFFDEFAEEQGYYPLDVNNWYYTTLEEIISKEGGEKMMRFYDKNIAATNVITALQQVYPELEFNPSKFVSLNPSYWLHLSNRKQFFISYASKCGFNPLVPTNWYSIDPKSIMAVKGVETLLPDRPSIVKNLLSVFPDIGLDKSSFNFLSGKYWITDVAEYMKRLFVQFAIDKGFDPLVPENWYSLSEEDILPHASSHELIWYQKSFTKSLISVFPDIGLQEHKFSHTNASKLVVSPKGYWNEVSNHRAMFETFANKSGFDPLVASNWYDKSFESLARMKGRRIIQEHYKVLSKALQQVFPNVNFNPSEFKIKRVRKKEL